jgi:hypothetical protein
LLPQHYHPADSAKAGRHPREFGNSLPRFNRPARGHYPIAADRRFGVMLWAQWPISAEWLIGFA